MQRGERETVCVAAQLPVVQGCEFLRIGVERGICVSGCGIFVQLGYGVLGGLKQSAENPMVMRAPEDPIGEQEL